MSNAQSGASYEAILVDNVSGPAAQIVQTLQRLDAAFRQVQVSAAPFAQNMQVIAAAMRQANRGPMEQATNIGMVFNRVSEMSSQLGSAAGRAIQGIGIVMERVGITAMAMSGAVVYGLLDVVKAAGDATETLNAFNVVIEVNTRVGRDAVAWADDFAKTLGRSSIQTKRAMTTYQSLWKGLGATNAQAANLTKTMVQLQTDFGSFFNVTDDESLRRFIAALSGSSEVLDQFGINIRENALEAKALQLGFGGNVRKMTEYQKALTRAAILSDVLGKRIGALGDAARTQFDWANQVRTLEARMLDLRVAMGRLVIPELKPYLQALVAVLGDLQSRFEKLDGSAVKQFLSGLVMLAGTGAALTALGVALAAVGSAVSIAAIAFAGLMTSIGALVAGGPIAALIVAITALGAALTAVIAIDIATQFPWAVAFENLKARVEESVRSVTVGLDTIRKAMAAGDYESAWEAFKLTGEIVFQQMALAFIETMGFAIDTTAANLAQNLSPTGLGMTIGQAVTGGAAGSLGFITKIHENIDKAKQKLRDLNKSLPEAPQPENKKGIADSTLNALGLDKVINTEQVWKKIQDAATSVKEAFEAARKESERIKKEANDWADDMRSPGEKFMAELQRIRLMEQMNVGGRVTPDMVARAQQQAAEKFMKELPKEKFQASSVGTFSRVVAKNAGDFAPAFDAQLDEARKHTKELQLIRQGIDKLDKGEHKF